MEKPLYIMDKLTEIMAWKRKELASRIRPVSSRELSSLGSKMGNENSFRNALSNDDELSVIAEIKRKSPSAGSIAENVSVGSSKNS